MEYKIKKKTKKIKNNCFIDKDIDKQSFFEELMESLKKKFTVEHLDFLFKYVLATNNSYRKKPQITHKRINTVNTVNEQTCYIAQIDPKIFIDEDKYKKKKQPLTTNNKIINIKNHCSTPRQTNNIIQFSSRQLLTLDRKLGKQYQDYSTRKIYHPDALFCPPPKKMSINVIYNKNKRKQKKILTQGGEKNNVFMPNLKKTTNKLIQNQNMIQCIPTSMLETFRKAKLVDLKLKCINRRMIKLN